MAVLNITFEPWERETIGADFTAVLADGETIKASPDSRIVAVDSSGNDVSDTVLDQDTITISDGIIQILWRDGVVNEKYSIHFRIETSLNFRYETNSKIMIREVGTVVL